MQRTIYISLITIIITFTMITSSGHADIMRGDDPPQITDIYDDLDEWLAAVPPVTVIDFTGFPPSTIITDQYADLGVNFVNGLYFIRSYPKTLCCVDSAICSHLPKNNLTGCANA